MKPNNDPLIDHLLILAGLGHADQNARRFAGDPGQDTELEKEIETLDRHRPLSKFIDSLRKRHAPEHSEFDHLLETYKLLNVFASISAFQDSRSNSAADAARSRRVVQQIQRFASRGMRHVRLVPDTDAYDPVVLDGACLIEKEHPESAKHRRETASASGPDGDGASPGSLPGSVTPNTLKKNPAGKYILDIDTDHTAELEIGDSAIRITLNGYVSRAESTPASGLRVFFNGIDPANQQTVTVEKPTVYRVSHAFEHPELINVTVIPGDPCEDLSLIFWCGVERDLISGILERVYPDPRHRLAWWWNSIDELDGLAPVQLIQRRREDRVLDYLCRRLDLKNKTLDE